MQEPGLSVARLANTVMREAAPQLRYTTLVLMSAEECNSSCLQVKGIEAVGGWLLPVPTGSGGEMWTALAQGDKVEGQVVCQMVSGASIAGQQVSVPQATAFPVPACRAWCFSSTAQASRCPVLLAVPSIPAALITPDLALQLKAMAFPPLNQEQPRADDVSRQGESPPVEHLHAELSRELSCVPSETELSHGTADPSAPSAGISHVRVELPCVPEEGRTSIARKGEEATIPAEVPRSGTLVPDVSKAQPQEEPSNGGVERDKGDRWYKNIPLPEVEPVDQSLYGYLGKDEDMQDVDGIRLMLLAASKDQETALAKELQVGETSLSEETVRNLSAINRTLASLEETLVSWSDGSFEGYEEEGPQNRDMRLSSIAVDEPELLQTKTIPVAEVAAAVDEWRAALMDEATSLISEHKACKPIAEEAVCKLEAHPDYEVVRVPGKIVATVKPPNRKKARLVACGNYLVRNKTKGSPALDRKDVYCANMDTFSLRAQLAIGGLQKGSAASLDVRTAFLTAPLQHDRTSNSRTKLIVVRAPRVMVLAGIFQANTWLLVQGALYGLRESPHSWGVSRDSKLSKLTWTGATSSRLELVQCEADVSLWRIKDQASQELKGSVGVYVDDLLLMAEESELQPLITAIRGVWRCSEPSFAATPGGFTFCGVQIEQVGPDLFIHQMKYMGDLQQRYEHVPLTAQLPDFKHEPAEEIPTPERVQHAQKIIGELTWVACRTRLDIAYAVNRLSRYAVSNPDFARQCGEQILGYLFYTAQVKLRYESAPAFQEELPVPRTPLLLEVWTDASFAQADSKSQSGIILALGGMTIGWLSLRQPFISLSTCEAELVSCVEGVVLAQAIRPLLEELTGSTLRWLLFNDNVAASTVILYPSGSWRTRHLRLRSRAIQKLIDLGELSLYHIPGRVMTADALTKTLTYTKISELLGYLGYVGFKPLTTKTRSSAKTPPKLLLLCAAAVSTAKAERDFVEGTSAQTSWLMIWVVVCGLVVLLLGYGMYLGYRRWVTRVRLQRLRELADEVVAETEAYERWLREQNNQGPQEPEPEANPEPRSFLWVVLAENGPALITLLGSAEPEIVALREVSGSIRLRVASAWATLFPRPPASPRNESQEETDSGFIPSSQSSVPSFTQEWDAVHAQYGHHPEYDATRVTDAFVIWGMSVRPYGPELEALPYVRALSPPEHMAFHQMISVYFERTQSSASSPTPEPAHLVSATAGDEAVMRNEMIARALEQQASSRRGRRQLEMSSPAALQGAEYSGQPAEEGHVRSSSVSSQGPGILRLPSEHASDSEESEAHEMDYQIAGAASLLYQYGYVFDWEQLTATQQHIYHGMIGRLLRSIEEVD